MTVSRPALPVGMTLLLLLSACDKGPWNNPFDPQTDLKTREWAPGNLQAQVINPAQIQLAWSQNVSRIAGFYVDRSEDGSTWTRIGVLPAPVRTYLDSGVVAGDVYYLYRVSAYAGDNVSAFSNLAGAGASWGTLVDIDGNTYQTVKIGDRWWLVQNLAVTHYRNGAPVPEITDVSAWSTLTGGAGCAYANNDGHRATYGLLYNWQALNDSRGLAPAGWHVPTDAEWQTLVDYLGGSAVAGGKLKAAGTDLWQSPNTGATNASEFTALPGGERREEGDFRDLQEAAFFWTATARDADQAWSWGLEYDTAEARRDHADKRSGFSVRCVRD